MVDEKSGCTRSRTAVGFSYVLWGGHADDDEYGGFTSSVESMSCEVLCAALGVLRQAVEECDVTCRQWSVW